MPTSSSSCSESSLFVRQLLSEKQGGGWKSTSKRYNMMSSSLSNSNHVHIGGGPGSAAAAAAGGMMMMMGGEKSRKRVMVVVDESVYSKHAMVWALTHVANKGDILTLLQLQADITTTHSPAAAAAHHLASLVTLCNTRKPEVQVEALVMQAGGSKLATVVRQQVKKLDVSVLVLGLNNPSSPFLRCLGIGGGMKSRRERFVEECINRVECCLTIGVRKQSKGIGGYLISTRWRKDFWLLA